MELIWNGKEASKASAGTKFEGAFSEPLPEGNCLIKADNLHALKLMQSTHKGKIKCIYIDPPYNTGKDFIYTDKRAYRGSKSDKHTAWLNFMYPRLMLARELLRGDGVIFISIDDHEVHHLRVIMDEIFGEENFVGDIIRKTKSTTNDAKTGFNIQHENCLIYAKDISCVALSGEEKDFSKYKNPDNDPRGAWINDNPSATRGSLSYIYEIHNPFTGKVDLPPAGGYWRFSKKSLQEHLESGKIVFREKHKPDERGFTFKRYKNELNSDFHLVNSLQFATNDFMNQVATKESINLFGKIKPFDFPKPVLFVRNLIKTLTKNDDIILDFFAGSGTTGQAVMELNAEDSGSRKFILVQLDEKIAEKNHDAIAFCKENKLPESVFSITAERLKRAGEKLDKELDAFASVDTGFKVLNTLKLKNI